MLFVSPQGEKGLQAVQGTKPAIITASRPITKMIVTQPKSMSSGSQSTATKIIPTKIVYGQQGKTQVRRHQQRLRAHVRLLFTSLINSLSVDCGVSDLVRWFLCGLFCPYVGINGKRGQDLLNHWTERLS